MASIKEAEKNLAQQQAFAQEQRKVIEESRLNIQKSREEALREEERVGQEIKKIPVPSQKLLRQGMYSGLEGRKRRRIAGKFKEELIGTKGLIGEFKTGLSTKEKEYEEYETGTLMPLERDISNLAKQIKEQKAEERAYNLALRIYFGEIKIINLKDLPHYKKVRRYLDMIVHSAKNQQTTSAPESSISILPEGGVSKVDTKIWTPITAQSQIRLITAQSQKICPITAQSQICPITATSPTGSISTPPAPSQSINLGKSFGVDLNTMKDIAKIQITKKMPILSFAATKIGEQHFLTTGSPKRYTGLYFPKPRLPPTPNKPKLGTLSQPKKLKKSSTNFFGSKLKSQKTKKKGRDRYDTIFGVKSKKAKGNSLWGF
jgi:hypothetical protein